uniref:RNA polymerase II transcription factor B subunit 2 n=1 Tax=Quercus lobata TaxID=97700 RepID=A0A7N2LQ65_QUELO
MPEVKIIAKNFMDMVASLPAMKLDKLYDNAFICEAILRSLPPLAKKYVLQMLYIDSPITAKSMEVWVLPDGSSKHRVAIDRLIQLRVFTETVDRRKETTYKINPTFQTNLQKLLTHGEVLPREPMPSNITVRLPSVEELDVYAIGQWECFLLQLISSAQAERPSNISSSMMKVFQRGLLSQRDKEAPRLTDSGFQFLLMDTNAQLWYIIREYISNSEERGVDPADLISFLLELSFHVTGEAYNSNTLTEVQRNTVKDLTDLGLVKLQQGRKESWFIPTKLATNLSVSLTDSSSRKQGFVVVETNFRLYAYSTSKLHCEILRLFSRVEYQLPNLIVGAITKESLYNAFENGITADQANILLQLTPELYSQIISFLQQNAHPRVAERIPTVPENVTDQIRLWESDLNRVEMNPAHYYDEFPSREIFEAACDHAREWNGLLWEDSKRMRLVVKAEIHIHMRDHLRGQKQ